MNVKSFLTRWSNEFQYKLTALLWGFFLYQYVVWFSRYWLDETVLLVGLTLLIVFAGEFLFFEASRFKRFVQLVAVVAIHARVLEYEPVPLTFETPEAFLASWVDNAAPFIPYFWFGLAAFFVYGFVLDKIRSKGRIIVTVIASIIVFCIVDSYSLYIFWDQVAILMVTGLLLVIGSHFALFKQRFPASWSYLKEYPGPLVATVMLLMGFIVGVGYLAPNIQPVVTDPYTAWKNYQGESVRIPGKGFAVPAFSTGPSSSGYSRNDEQLGSGFDFDYSPVMEVDTSHPGYWRGETRTFYNGSGWERTEDEAQRYADELTEVVENNDLTASPLFDTSQRKTVEVTQTVSMLDERSYPVLFGAMAPQRLTQVGDGEENTFDPAAWLPSQSTLLWNEDAEFPATWSVTSRVTVMEPSKLRTVPAEYPDTPVLRPYLQLPDSLPERVVNMAQEVAGSSDNAYDAVKRIETWLKTEFPYTNQPDLSKGESDDFVDRFLFEIQEGYCDYYSTAMVVMVRSLGIPARWVKGYTAGSQLLPEELEEMITGGLLEDELLNGPGVYTVSNANAHSWVEVYFPGWGWIPFEPTSGFAIPVTGEEEEETVDPLEPVDIEASPDTASSDSGTRTAFTIIAVAGILLFALTAGWIVLRKTGWKLPWLGRSLSSGKRPDANHKVILEFERLLRYAKRKGLDYNPHETVREMQARWSAKYRFLETDLAVAIRLFEQAKYSGRILEQPDAERLSEAIGKLKEKMK